MRRAELLGTGITVELLGSVTYETRTALSPRVIMPAAKIRAIVRTPLSADRCLQPGEIAVIPPYRIQEVL